MRNCFIKLTPDLCNEAIVHGRTYESLARENFQNKFKIHVMNCGLFINPKFPFIAATPDGVINSDYIVEIKCPYVARNMEVRPGKFFPFLCLVDDKICLKPTHNYYYQIQGQLGISQRKYCYLIIYTHIDLFVLTISFNEIFFYEELVPKLKVFYDEIYCPFIASKL